MIIQFSKKHLVFSLFIALLMISLVLYGYFIILNPMKDETKSILSQIDLQQKVLTKGEAVSKNDDKNLINADTALLLREVPIKPLEEQILLYLEKAENVSKVTISSISTATTTDRSGQKVDDILDSQTVENDDKSSQVDKNSLSELLLTLQVKYSYYEDLHDFLQEIESSTRILQVESLNFTNKSESETNLSAPVKSIATIVIKGFYAANLKALSKQDPTIDVPASCEQRTNPIEIQQCLKK